MIPSPIPENERERQASLERMTILSTPRESDLDRIARLAKKIFGVEIALISLLDGERQWFKSCYGLGATETSRDISFCGHAIEGETAMVVPDASQDARFHDNPLVTDGPKIRFYAGQPLTNADGYRIGTLCVISPRARDVSDAEREALEDLGRLAEITLVARDLGETQTTLLEELDTARREALVDPLSGLWNRRGVDILIEREFAQARRVGEPLAVAMVDIDRFKRINDAFGHAKGDEAIRLAAEIIRFCARSYDVVGRFGGEEFIVVTRGMRSVVLPKIGQKLVDAFRTKAKLPLEGGITHDFTASVGLTLAQPAILAQITPAALVQAADQALYQAKEAGRDRYEIADIAETLDTV